MTVFENFLKQYGFAKAKHVLIFTCLFFSTPGMIRIGNPRNVFVNKIPVGTVHHTAHFPCVNEEHLTTTVAEFSILAIAREKPETGGDLCGIK